MKTFSIAALSLLLALSTTAKADSRFVGMFYPNGMGVILDTGVKVPKPKFVMPAGHVPGAELKLPKRTMERFKSPSDQLPSILPAANLRFTEKLADLRKHPELVRLAKTIAPKYNVDPAAVVAAVLVEMTFNNDYSMKLQNFAAYFPSQNFYPGANSLIEQIPKTQMKLCKPERSDYWTWVCLNILWDNNIWAIQHGTPIMMQAYIPMPPNEVAIVGKLSPSLATLSAGMSFGPAQITLFRALMASEDVTRVSGGKFPRVTISDMPAVQRMIAEIEPSVHIISATLGRSIYAYRKYPRIDISKNLGLLATIFNVGYEVQRATKLSQANIFAKTETMQLPKENYFGYFANEHEQEIRALVNEVN